MWRKMARWAEAQRSAWKAVAACPCSPVWAETRLLACVLRPANEKLQLHVNHQFRFGISYDGGKLSDVRHHGREVECARVALPRAHVKGLAATAVQATPVGQASPPQHHRPPAAACGPPCPVPRLERRRASSQGARTGPALCMQSMREHHHKVISHQWRELASSGRR